ncbi:MAG TPA: lycopene cyclase domain-containing protein [Amnibacterium sp.]|jgi:lycopene cyclase domain-containing protein|nr:lycopene cyclase domain-containing protein [Amnibacterium sp.]
MSALYLAALVVSIAGLLVLDGRYRLFVFAAPVRALVVLAAGVLGFLLWDLAGVGLGIFFEGNHALLTGADVAREVPVEELCFLVLLCLTAMESYGIARRLLPSGGRP